MTPHVLRHTINVFRRQTGLDSTARSTLLTHTNLGSLVSYERLDSFAAELVPARARQRSGLESYVKEAALKSYEEHPRELWGTRPALEDK